MDEFIAIGRNAVIIMGAVAVFSAFFVVTTLWLTRNTVEPEQEVGY